MEKHNSKLLNTKKLNDEQQETQS